MGYVPPQGSGLTGVIKRSQLEYPTEDVSFAYLVAIGKVTAGGATWLQVAAVPVTSDAFTDKAVSAVIQNYTTPCCYGRYSDPSNYYACGIYIGATTADFIIEIDNAGTLSSLAAEAVDLDTSCFQEVKLEISGSTINAYRSPQNALGLPATPNTSATDTTFASGSFGFNAQSSGSYSQGGGELTAMLLAPGTQLQTAQRIVEVEVKDESPVFKQELVEINQLINVPDFLKQGVKRYEILKAKGFRDEEIEAVFGEIPQHQVDLSAVTWGSFDYKGEPTMLIAITGDNPYKHGAILRQEEYAKSKNLKVYKPPKDYAEAVEQYRMLKKDFPHWMAGKDNYAYQTLGWEELNYLQVADTYYGNIVDGIKPNAYKNGPDWEMRNELERWLKRLEHITALPDERDKHIKKLKEVEKKGW